jgi:hypothetical protein
LAYALAATLAQHQSTTKPQLLAALNVKVVMKITGYKKEDTELEGCMVLSDIGIAASPDTLRDLAAFLLSAADEMEELGEDYGHLHLMDEWPKWKESYADIQVLSEKYI